MVNGRSNGEMSEPVAGNIRRANLANELSRSGSWRIKNPPGFNMRLISRAATSRSRW